MFFFLLFTCNDWADNDEPQFVPHGRHGRAQLRPLMGQEGEEERGNHQFLDESDGEPGNIWRRDIQCRKY